MKWKKLGLIFNSNKESDWMYSHAMIPVAEHLYDDIFRIYFSPRDKENRGHGAYLEIDINEPQKILNLSKEPVLEPGELGCFDDSGALPNSLLEINGEKYLYYTGINIGVTVKIRNSIGLAKWNNEKNVFERVYKGPIIDRTKESPHFTATPEVIYDNGIYKSWFTSCVKWEKINNEVKHFYNLEYAESTDGINWKRDKNIAIDFKDEFEYALGVPRVKKDNDLYKMWFCSRATKDIPTYRIRYAESNDGINWIRKDEVGIDVSKDGWDSEMICYPFIFDHKDKRYMLYNGNGYGKTGFGLAILESNE
ncbi:hypothetical protein L5F37_08130 [Aliarcobacter butzleri]|uniref:hypothetical protein n=1 Tax=Aliarcobacter butzleri TaxID=28197 RepID=UPI001EDA2CAD|nr:hypothetical protein [Aliarcobacter butzleri]MCG3663364.1 hypothetical protein [Aliarcobacter butzleri]